MQLIGRYRLRERIGEGATADVYRAFDPEIGRDLAIKVLKAEFCANAEYAERFLCEARAAGALSHPNIVTIYDVGEASGHPYIAMELLEGEALDELLSRGEQLTLAVAMRVGVQLAEALSYAHAQGVVHRDIKPSNVFLGPDGETAKILDFGIARIAERDQTTFQAASPRTQIGLVMGTPRYMSPEQARGHDLDGRSDLFSVGALLYELISGKRAFNGPNAVAIALQITQSEPVPLNEAAPQAPAGLTTIINKLLAKRRERRFANGAQVAVALKRELAQHQAARDEGRWRLPLQARLTIGITAAVAVVLTLSIAAVTRCEYATMRRMTLTSGEAITSFVASNVALTAADNATLPAAQRDWLPVQAFTKVAGDDPNVQRISIIDADGVVAASSDPSNVGRPFRVGPVQGAETRDAKGAAGFRFVRPILYAGRRMGLVDVEIAAGDLNAAANLSIALMVGLGVATLAAVMLASALTTRILTHSIRRLKDALDAALEGDFEVRIGHRRPDELGRTFDSFNRLANFIDNRLMVSRTNVSPPAAVAVIAPATDLDRTLITDLPLAGAQPQAEAMSRLWDLLRRRKVA